MSNLSSQMTRQADKNNKYKELYHDIMHQLECEKKLNQSMVDCLENKVSELIAENGTLKLQNIQLAKSHKEIE